jgi:hypothetical protein
MQSFDIVSHDYGMFSTAGNDAVQGVVNAIVNMSGNATEGELTDVTLRMLHSLSFIEAYSEAIDTVVRENVFSTINYKLSNADFTHKIVGSEV